MKFEYLAFNAVIAGSVIISALCCPKPYKRYWPHALGAILLCAFPYLVWDALVTGRHWDFNPTYVLSPRVYGLPLGELLFFFTVPMATLFTWEMLFADPVLDAQPALARFPQKSAALLLLAGCAALGLDKEYTGLASLALLGAMLADHKAKSGVFSELRCAALGGFVLAWTGIFNGYLTARPVVRYNAVYQLNFRIGTIPIEDFVYGLSLLAWVLVLYRYACRKWPRPAEPNAQAALMELRAKSSLEPWIRAWVKGRIGPYKRVVVQSDQALPKQCKTTTKVIVVGAGLAGMRAASLLASRGIQVRLIEKAHYLGGKIGAFEVPGPKGKPVSIEHGFHAFFPHYYNTQAYLRDVGADTCMQRIEDYLILAPDGKRYSYKDTHTTPLLNLLSLWRQGHYRIRDLIVRPRSLKLATLLRYDPQKTFSTFDNISYAEFSKSAQIPASLALTFNSFSRAFFAPPEKMSMAELIKSFHFFFLGHDGGLLYDYPDQNYQDALITPMHQDLLAKGVEVQTNLAVTAIERSDQSFVVHTQDGAQDRADHVVLACDVAGVRSIAKASPQLATLDPDLHARLSREPSTNPYAVWRIWVNRALTPENQSELAKFIITDRKRILDSVTFYDRFETQSHDWVKSCPHPASVLELHSYCVPEDLAEPELCKAAMLADLADFLPEFSGAELVAEHFALNRDFPAFFIGEHERRPSVQSSIPGLYLAGDWVRLPHPAMLMEAATMSGVLAANAIFETLGLSLARVWSVPPRGLLAPSGKIASEPGPAPHV